MMMKMRMKMKNSTGKKKKKKGPIGLSAAIRDIEKKCGKGSIMKLGGQVEVSGPSVSTSSMSLDCALGGLGLQFGRVVEIYGPESSGKTTLALHILANVQKLGLKGAMVDAEHAIDPPYTKKIGVNLDDLLFSQPDYGEQALGIVQKLIMSGEVKVIIVDSVAALVPKKELEGEMDEETIGLQARLMGKALRKIVGYANKYGVLVIFLNQERDKIGGFSRGGKTTPGGKALKFWASIRIEIKRIKTDKEKEKAVSNLTYAKVVKSKVCSPFKVGKFFITFGKGIDKYKELFFWAKQGKIIKRRGSTYKYGNIKTKGQKRFINKLKENKKLRKEIVKKTKKYIQETL
jgi:recombination protein RecA